MYIEANTTQTQQYYPQSLNTLHAPTSNNLVSVSCSFVSYSVDITKNVNIDKNNRNCYDKFQLGTVNRMSVMSQQLQQFKSQQTMQVDYIAGEIVWAKIMGYPWWPATVDRIIKDTESAEPNYFVRFFGDDSHSTLNFSKLAKYSENKTSFAKKASTFKLLKQAIAVAENIIAGRSSIERQLKRAKGTRIVIEDSEDLASPKSSEEAVKQAMETESTKHHCLESQEVIKSETVMEVESQIEQELIGEDKASLEEIEMQGIDERNVVDILESGLLKRLKRVDKDRAERLQRIAKKALLRKYFQKKVPEKVKEPRSRVTFVENQKPIDILPRKKPISKPSRAQKPIANEIEIEGKCVRRLHQIMKMFLIDSESSRTISLNTVLKLKLFYGTNSPQFQKQFLSFIEWLKTHSSNPEFVKEYYEKFLETETISDISKYTQQTNQLLTTTIQY